MWAGFAALGTLQTEQQEAPLDSASRAHCSAAWSMALPGIYRPSLRIRRNKTKREGPTPDSQRESHKNQTAKGKQQEPKRGKTERGGR